MAITYGLTDQGFVKKPLTVIREELNDVFRNAFGSSISLHDRSIFGIIVGILAERFSLIWELLEVISASQDPDKATGALLRSICTLTGTFELAPSPSNVTLTLVGDDGTAIAAGTIVQTFSTHKDFVTLEDAVISQQDSWFPTTSYDVDDRVYNGTPQYVFRCVIAGTSAGGAGPQGTIGPLVVDGSCTWEILGEGTGYVDTLAESTETGQVVGAPRDINVIVNAISGWDTVTNFQGAELGRDVETNAELRQRRDDELAAAGNSPFDALRAELLKIIGVTSVTLFPNNSDLTDADGVPPHAVEALVRGGDDQDIFDSLLAGVAVGIGTHGNQVGAATDSQGTSQVEKFSRATEVPIFSRIEISNDDDYPLDGDLQVQTAILAYGAAQPTGRDAVLAAIAAQPFKIDGVLDVTRVSLFTEAITTVTSWTPATAYVATPGARSMVINGGRTYACVTSGTSAGSSGPLGTGADIVDNTAHWRCLNVNVNITTRELATYLLANVIVVATPGGVA